MNRATIEDSQLHRLGLIRCVPDQLDIIRKRHGRGFRYFDRAGCSVSDTQLRKRLKQLAVPPAWQDARLSSERMFHIQAVGRDPKGRRQYRYHDSWADVRSAIKWERLWQFGLALPSIRKWTRSSIGRSSVTEETICAAAIALIDGCHLRPGAAVYTESNQSHGATTLRHEHISIKNGVIELQYVAKGNRKVAKTLRDRELARFLQMLTSVQTQFLFEQSLNSETFHATSGNLNECLRAVSNRDVSCKDFRTFHANACAVASLARIEPSPNRQKRQRQFMSTCRAIAGELHNTPQMTKTSYVHSRVRELWADGSIRASLTRGRRRRMLSRDETALMRLLDNDRKVNSKNS
jgi:DNA topoisomerase-1